MAKTRNMTRKHDHDASSSSSSYSSKMFKTFDMDGVAPWLDLNHDVFFLVMMHLGVVDFLAFSGVCKSWRSFALFNRNTFMASRLPMSISIDHRANNQDSYLILKDFEGRRFKIILPHSAGRFCVGVTCGYLILYKRETRDFWLVNPITRHQLHFPDFPLYACVNLLSFRAILVFSASISGWVFVTVASNVWHHHENKPSILFSIEGKQGWNHVPSTLPILDLHVFKGKIYTLNADCCLCELRLDLKWKRKWTLLEIKRFPKPNFFRPKLVSSGENLYMVNESYPSHTIQELDFGKMEWVSPEKTIGEYVFFFSRNKSSVAIKQGSWYGPPPQYNSGNYSADTDKSQRYMFYHTWMWYSPHDCLNANFVDEC